MQYEHCSAENLGLKICIRLKDNKIKLNEDFELSLVFKNISKYPLRIYWAEAVGRDSNGIYKSLQKEE